MPSLEIQVEQPAPRLDQYLAENLPHLSRAKIQKLIRRGEVVVASPPGLETRRVKRPSAGVQPGDVIILNLPPPQPAALHPEPLPLAVVCEDEAVVVVDKPAGLVVHPAPGHRRGTLVNALLARYPDLAAMRPVEVQAADRPGIVHRLDRDTSGLIVIARTPQALDHLRRQFKARTVEKTYLALVFGRPEAPAGVIDAPLGRHPRHRQKFAVQSGGKPARTHYRLREDFGSYSLLEIGLETGRTHQIRVHLAWLGHPVVGDTVYGRQKNSLGLERQFLHAWRLRFEHPKTGEPVEVEAPVPEDLQTVLDGLVIGNW